MTSKGVQIAQCVQQQYDRLPKTGKPQVHGPSKTGAAGKVQWTILAGIIQEQEDKDPSKRLKCVSLGVGLKCLPGERVPKTGDCILDSHAEVLAVRAWRRYLWQEIKACIEGKASIFRQTTQKDPEELGHISFKEPQPRFHLYVSQAPWDDIGGDASVETLAEEQDEASRAAYEGYGGVKRPEVEDEEGDRKRRRVHEDGQESRERIRGRNHYARTGALRTKPGRVDSSPTHSMSCSDKMAIWHVCGAQGALLSLVHPSPIRLSSVTIGERLREESVRRAIHLRLVPLLPERDMPLPSSPPTIQSAGASWVDGLEERRLKYPDYTPIPLPTALYWVLGDNKAQVLGPQGRKQGAAPLRGTKVYPAKARPSVCKAAFAQLYLELKQASKAYQDQKSLVKQGPFRGWLGCGALANDFPVGNEDEEN
ncbi:MAG: hypothetical protein DHS80DRAFT_32242 [Piptocephalis tieghemiana]|nr:MAG: hypothetical protein DHS80DRAFT_32242 [Piptocephalis tieghemiana]